MEPDRLEEIKFHWEKWKGESKAFWGRAALGSAILLISIAFQFGIVRISVADWVTISPPSDPRSFYVSLNILSWLLLGFLAFKFLDLLRHRVPEEFANDVHNERLPIASKTLPLKVIGQIAYIIFILYFIALTVLLGCAAWHIFSIDLSGQARQVGIEPHKKTPSATEGVTIEIFPPNSLSPQARGPRHPRH